uniref:Uncharacterized protein n=1 Tax=viral metagenome TaxID=1070528 RepID=A0A6C0KBI3_9ZZZZ
MEYSEAVSTPLGKESKVSVSGSALEVQTPPLKVHAITEKEIIILETDMPETLRQWFGEVAEHSTAWYGGFQTRGKHRSVDLPQNGLYTFKLKQNLRRFKITDQQMCIATAGDISTGVTAVLVIRAPVVRMTKRTYGLAWFVREVCVLDCPK